MGQSLRVVFLGTPDFAVASLNAINKSCHKVVGVVTMPDKPMGRGHKLQGSAVKKYSLENKLPLLQPEKLKKPEFIKELRAMKADIFVVVAFRMLPEVVWNMPKHGTVNVHGSLLPQYRGAAPINWAIINGDSETGVTVFRLKHEIDTGDVLLRKSTSISPEDNAGAIHDKLMHLGATAVVEALDIIATGMPKYLPQLENINLKKAPKIFKDTCKVNWNSDCKTIQNHIRGLSPYPAAWSIFSDNGNPINFKIYCSKIELSIGTVPGEITTDNKTYLKVGTNDGYICLLEIQIAGKKRMPIADLLRGYSFTNISKILS